MAEDSDTIAAPALPTANVKYSRMSTEGMNNVLRLFFNRLIAITNYLVGRNVVAFHSDVDGEIEALTNKPLPVREDVLLIEDSEDSWAKKEIKIGDLMSDFYLEVAKGNVAGHTSVNKFGENFLITADTQEDIWDGGGDYVYPTTATITHIRSAVDSAATQGLSVEVQGLDASWALVTQTATLDGTTSTVEVLLTTALIRVFRMKVTDNVIADQDIWIGATGVAAATSKAIITAGNNQTLMALFTVPAGKTAYMTKYFASLTLTVSKDALGCNLRIWAADRANGYEFQLKHSCGIQGSAAGIEHNFMPYEKFTEKTDIRLAGTPNVNDGQIAGGFDLIVVDN